MEVPLSMVVRQHEATKGQGREVPTLKEKEAHGKDEGGRSPPRARDGARSAAHRSAERGSRLWLEQATVVSFDGSTLISFFSPTRWR